VNGINVSSQVSLAHVVVFEMKQSTTSSPSISSTALLTATESGNIIGVVFEDVNVNGIHVGV
jgi:hypothetical protein